MGQSNDDVDGHKIISMAHGQGGDEIGLDRSPTLTCNHEAPIAAYPATTHTLRGEGFDASEDGTGRGTPLVPVAFNARQDPDHWLDRTGPLDTDGSTQAVAFDTTQITSAVNRSNPKPGDPCHPLAAGAHAPAVAFQERGRKDGRSFEVGGDVAYALTAPNGGGRAQERNVLTPTMQVRRLTPRECERLQGFPDGYTRIPWKLGYWSADKHPPEVRAAIAEQCPDGPRYKALGNSWAVPCVTWIGQRIAASLE